MLLAAVLPLIVVGVVIAIVLRSVEQNRRQEAQRRAAEMKQPQTPSEGQAQYTPVRPSVQAAPVRREPAFRPEGTAVKGPSMHQEHDLCALKQETPNANGKHPEHDDCALRPEERKEPASAAAAKTGGTLLSLEPDDIVRGVLFSEILGKPKALR